MYNISGFFLGMGVGCVCVGGYGFGVLGWVGGADAVNSTIKLLECTVINIYAIKTLYVDAVHV